MDFRCSSGRVSRINLTTGPVASASSARLILSLPGIHCVNCLTVVERGLGAVPGVRSARVNLSLRRVSVEGDPAVTADGLVKALRHLGYEAHELDPGLLSVAETDRHGRDLLLRLAVAGFAMMNVMLLSVAVWAGAGDQARWLFHWTSAAITVPAVTYAGMPFFRSAFASLRAGRLGMDVPISLALVLSTAISVSETVMGGQRAWFEAAVMLTFFLLAGRYLDHRTRAIARSAAQELSALEVPRATVLRDDIEINLSIADIRAGDLVRVRPGGRLPVDGIVTDGASEIDRSLLTGEGLPFPAGPGTAVSAGEVNLTGLLTLRVTQAGRDSSLHRMADLVAVAESARSGYTSLAERAARLYAPLVHVLAAVAFTGWWWGTGDLRLALNIAAAVLIITCPCGLGLAVPAVVTAASGRLFRLGLLVKDGTALERLAEVDTVVFDKTGTLTLGAPEPVGLGAHSDAVLSVAAALAGASSHPLARALAGCAAGRATAAPAAVTDLREVPGHGVEGILDGQRVRLGRAAWVGAKELDVTATYLSMDGQTHGFAFIDRLRPGAEQAVAGLVAQGKRIVLLSGDTEAPVAEIAARLGISDWTASVLPADKAARIAALAAEGHKVLMVGDGLNDTAALASAHVSISPASALDAARAASDIVLLGNDMSPIAEAARVAVRARRRIVENFAISALYNVVAVPLALAGLATPLIAAIAMSISSVTVTLNALRLR